MKNDKDNDTKEPSWLRGQVAKCHSSSSEKNQSGEHRSESQIQFSRRRTRSSNRDRRYERSCDSNHETSESCEGTSHEVSGDHDQRDDGKPRSERRLTKIRLGDIFAALTPEQIEEISTGQLTNPDEEVEVRYSVIQSPTVKSFTEDSILQPKRRRRKKPIGPKRTPTKTLSDEYTKWLETEPHVTTPEVVLGCYLKLYKEGCGEEDASVSDKDLRNIYFYIRKMASDVANGNLESIVLFVQNLVPLWFKNIDPNGFPNTRPTTKAFFINRNIWNNRRIYYQRWKR